MDKGLDANAGVLKKVDKCKIQRQRWNQKQKLKWFAKVNTEYWSFEACVEKKGCFTAVT